MTWNNTKNYPQTEDKFNVALAIILAHRLSNKKKKKKNLSPRKIK